MKVIKCIGFFVMRLILFSGCQTNGSDKIEVKMKSDEDLKEIADTYTYEDYEKVFEKAVSDADELEADGSLNKWLIRILAEEQLSYESDLTDDQVIKLAERALKEDEVWKSIAKEKYGVTVTEEEVDQYIKEGPDTFELPQMQAYAAALGLSLEELNHEFDRDIYEKNAIWLKLKPELEKEYGLIDNNKQVEKYQEEVDKGVY
ncbi:hypothetical protein D3H55_21155 [Bacillus salacetis]|uniref:Uncharacterized protein n=1 Tax=Bacillus salacetis TaxID=2315464 RepID=A0A3A1QQW9_9BACI|nr:hypothetical protein [Bacillus salacetis]RIW28686.1 hypothetical protein D3H55_21155 [Bacillus salacetis]